MEHFKISGIGDVDYPSQLVFLAQHEKSTVPHRPDLEAQTIADLRERVRGIKSHIEAGVPKLSAADYEDLGTKLFEFLIDGKVRTLFDRAVASRPGQALPIELAFEDPELASWPWEFAFDRSTELFVARSRNPINRNILDLSSAITQKSENSQPRVLVLVGVAPNEKKIKWEEEVELLKTIFGSSGSEIEVIAADEIGTIATILNGTTEYDVVHFVGHAGYNRKEKTGYLAFERSGGKKKVSATLFAELLYGSKTRLVFLNACQTAVGDPEGNIARTSVASALIDAGVNVVVGTQFSLPERTAQVFAESVYQNLLTGVSVAEAVSKGRITMSLEVEATGFDWAVPSLFCGNPDLSLFERLKEEKESLGVEVDNSSIVANEAKRGRVRILIIDIDTDAGFLRKVCEKANAAQEYFSFQVGYFPIPSGYVNTIGKWDPQTHLPHLEKIFQKAEKDLDVDFICGVTKNMISTIPSEIEFSLNLIAAKIPETHKSSAVSTFGLREYAALAEVDFAKSVLIVVLSIVLYNDPRWKLQYHPETVGCLFDLCADRRDLVVGLKHMKFDHQICRDKITDQSLLNAIDAIAKI